MRGGRKQLTLVALALGTAAAVVAALFLVSTRDDDVAGAPGSPEASEASDVKRVSAADPVGSFIGTYIDDDGRVVRHDEGGDTVSEGQSYGLMLAVATEDEELFERVWTWTKDNLQRPDGLLAWRWVDGEVDDAESATDADIDSAHALVVAGEVFDDQQWRADGLEMAEAVLDVETVETDLGRLATAGSWDQTGPRTLNASYAWPLAMQRLAVETGDERWSELEQGQTALLDELFAQFDLPPDWAQLEGDGSVVAMPPPAQRDVGGGVAHGLDAARIPVHDATSCRPADIDRAASLADVLVKPVEEIRGIYDLGGSPAVEWNHPLAVVAAASAADADGRDEQSRALIDGAEQLDVDAPTYYGSGWVALGTVFLTAPGPFGCDRFDLEGGTS